MLQFTTFNKAELIYACIIVIGLLYQSVEGKNKPRVLQIVEQAFSDFDLRQSILMHLCYFYMILNEQEIQKIKNDIQKMGDEITRLLVSNIPIRECDDNCEIKDGTLLHSNKCLNDYYSGLRDHVKISTAVKYYLNKGVDGDTICNNLDEYKALMHVELNGVKVDELLNMLTFNKLLINTMQEWKKSNSINDDLRFINYMFKIKRVYESYTSLTPVLLRHVPVSKELPGYWGPAADKLLIKACYETGCGMTSKEWAFSNGYGDGTIIPMSIINMLGDEFEWIPEQTQKNRARAIKAKKFRATFWSKIVNDFFCGESCL